MKKEKICTRCKTHSCLSNLKVCQRCKLYHVEYYRVKRMQTLEDSYRRALSDPERATRMRGDINREGQAPSWREIAILLASTHPDRPSSIEGLMKARQ